MSQTPSGLVNQTAFRTWFRPVPSLLIYQVSATKDIDTDGHLVIFDLDWTLTRPVHGKFPKHSQDVVVLPGRKEKLKQLVEEGYNIVIVTNQKSRHEVDVEESRRRIEYAVSLLDVPVVVFVATADDEYRKPGPGIWQIIKEIFPTGTGGDSGLDAYYVGDAAGRPQDFSDSDRRWAEKSGIPFYTPEEFFDSKMPVLQPDRKKHMILLAGQSGSGKSSYYQQHLQPLGYMHINKDTLKDKRRVMRATEDALVGGKNVAIDETNPTKAGRREFLDLARRYGYTVSILYLVRNGVEWNKLRPKPVPDVAYNIYFKNLEEPSEEELREAGVTGDVQEVWF